MTRLECWQEGLRRVRQSDALWEEYCLTGDERIHRQLNHLRQTAMVYASLAGAKFDGIEGS